MFYLFLSFLTGVTIVINMMLNGRLAQREGMINSVLINYVMATLSSLLLCGLMLNALPSYASIAAVPWPYFLGGFMGVLTTWLFNLIVPRVPAVYVVILRFVGQMLAGAAIDYIFLDVFSRGKIIGGLLFLLGLMLNARADGKNTKTAEEGMLQ